APQRHVHDSGFPCRRRAPAAGQPRAGGGASPARTPHLPKPICHPDGAATANLPLHRKRQRL
ncbi:MAG: hypothetical protein AVDCRST_MAG89-308, partial [uncultured Gemmatimonadetes bacterium]